MGTSKSHSGSSDTVPAIPDWASAGGEAEGAAPPDGDGPEAPGVTAPGAWRKAKSSLTRATGVGAGAGALRQAGRDYVRALGGSRGATRSASSGRSAGTALGAFLSDVSSQGLRPALANLGLAHLVGRDVHTVLLAVGNAVSPEGASREAAAARRAALEALRELGQQIEADGKDLESLDAVSPELLRATVEAFIAAYVYERWLAELGLRIEKKATTEAQAVRLEREVKAFVKSLVKLDFREVDVARFDWKGVAGRNLVERLLGEAYGLLEGS